MISLRRAVSITGGVLLAIAVAGCGSSSPTSAGNPSGGTSPSAASSSASPRSGSAAIGIQSFSYTTPASVTPGATVTVTNHDSVAHTVTSDTSGQFNVNVQPGGSATFTAPNSPGTYKFHCIYHGNMHGTLVVK